MKRWMALWGLVLCPHAVFGQVERSEYFGTDFQLAAIQSVVRLQVQSDRGTVQGSGVCIGHKDRHSYILTAEHVVRGAQSIQIAVFTRDSFPKPAQTYDPRCRFWVNREYDLGLIIAPVWVPLVTKVCPKDMKLRVNEPMLSVGCGVGSPPVCQVGAIIGRDHVGDLVSNRGSIGGRSGGALFVSAGLVGIAARGSPDRSYFVDRDKIHPFLEQTGNTWLITPGNR